MASILGNLILGFVDDISESINESRRQSREEAYDWACRRTDEKRAQYNVAARHANAWLDEVDRLQAELNQLEPLMYSPNCTSWDCARYNQLKSALRRVKHYAQDEVDRARSAQADYRRRQEVELKRSANCGRTDFGWDLF